MNYFKTNLLAALIALGTTLVASDARAAECVGVSMPDTIEVAGKKLKLNGQGIREATLMKVDVYVAGLWVTETSNDGRTLAKKDAPKKLVLHFVRDVDKDKIVDAYKESFKKSAGSKYGELEPKLDKLNSWMSDAKEGQKQVYTYVPGKGLTVEVAGKTKGTIEGNDFTEAFFLIWLGSNPPNPGLKRGLLGGKCD
jgi:hypothetical protein